MPSCGYPNDFSRRLAAGDAQVQLLVHGSEASRATDHTRLCQQRPGANGPSARPTGEGARTGRGRHCIRLIERMWFNSANTSTWYLVPGLIVLIMTLVGAFLTAMVMAREWERGTLEALFVSPVRPTEILLAKIIPYFLVGMLGLGMCLLAARFLFEVPMYGSLLIILGSSMLYMLVALGIGLVISSVTKNQFLASQIALISSFMPALMLSGFLFDLRNVPTVIYLVGQAAACHLFHGTDQDIVSRRQCLAADFQELRDPGRATRCCCWGWRGSSRARSWTDAMLDFLAPHRQPVPQGTAGHPERSRQSGHPRRSLADGKLSVRLCRHL